ncbi:peptidoglycan D,D-transpeptidase FtsI family protein [Paenibacillus ginsengarvi]|uniref:Penicillin-binding protein 2 n=1 Tax=Paenibacillus ginsengarvi TaxID=400777 RepID=A0A3B0C7R2_9BACL|nr:penicillin-binding protein 2 [Paenibacillus ginsengarvi]RKN80554.1 penicillin-binding protein 2 [Paenibacillus ginsengarvi]
MVWMRQRRIWFSLLVITLLLGIWLGRLAWIQVIDTGSFSRRDIDLTRNSVAQREVGIELDSGRGGFVDRLGKPLTGETVKALVVFPLSRSETQYAGALAEAGAILQADGKVWNDFVSSAVSPAMWTDAASGLPVALTDKQVRILTGLDIPGIVVMDTVRRYPGDGAARHVIGYIGQNPQRIESEFARQLLSGSLTMTSRIGASGLEKTMETYLQSVGKTSVSLFTDGAHRPLAGLNVRLIQPNNPYYPLQVNTTLDLDLQKQAERLLDKAGIASGAAVILDANNADVLAMASRPDFDPYRVTPQDGNWGNKALKAITPGSVFKTVVAAAALEEGVVQPGETFECNGELGKYGFTCWLHGGHGTITFEEGFAKSCNIVFARVMQRLSGSKLQEVADRLGLDRQVGWSAGNNDGKSWSQFDGEERGQIFAGRTPSEDEGVRVQTAIGQRDVLVSPLQAANLVVTLLHGGEVRSPRIVTDVRYRTGAVVKSFPERVLVSGKAGIPAKTAGTILDFMQEVVSEGTGQSLQNAKWHLAGKSGTAQTACGGRPCVHSWFVGYGPAEKPKYAVAVVAENEPENTASRAIAAFRDIMDMLAERENKLLPRDK